MLNSENSYPYLVPELRKLSVFAVKYYDRYGYSVYAPIRLRKFLFPSLMSSCIMKVLDFIKCFFYGY